MKKVISIVIAIIALLAMTVPAMAQGAPTNVTIASAGGNAPIVKCKWEQDTTPDLEDGDVGHATPGSQFLPPGVKCTTKTICYYAVVTDAEDMGDVAQVFAEVFHPADSPPPYNCSTSIKGPLFKYQVDMSWVADGNDAGFLPLLNAAYNAGLITFGSGHSMATIIAQKDSCAIWYGCKEIDYEQPAGLYDVFVYAIDTSPNLSAALYNQFEYVATPLLEVDFDSFTYGSTGLKKEKMVPGDLVWSVPAGDPAGFDMPDKATIRNVGNTWASAVITQDDMGFDPGDVRYDARMGNDDLYYIQYFPDTPTTLTNYLDLSTLEELDLSIYVLKGVPGQVYTGEIEIEAVAVPFAPYDCDGTGKPDALFGVADPCP